MWLFLFVFYGFFLHTFFSFSRIVRVFLLLFLVFCFNILIFFGIFFGILCALMLLLFSSSSSYFSITESALLLWHSIGN